MPNNKSSKIPPRPYRFIFALTLISVFSLGLLTLRVNFTDSSRYVFLTWNLVLASVPLFLAWWLTSRIRRYGWIKWQQLGLTIMWLAFLPNSFYLITDLIHLRPNYEADLLFDITLLSSFIFTGFILGITSVYLVHSELIRRSRSAHAYLIVSVIFLAVSFAICLGRYTRWNTWDIILRPAGLLFDVSDRLINPGVHLQTYQTTLVLFLLIFSVYIVVWEAARLLRVK